MSRRIRKSSCSVGIVGALLGMTLCATAAPAQAADCVVLLHGLGRTHLSMTTLQFALENAGYKVWNKGYDSTSAPIEQLAPIVGTAVEHCRSQGAERVHFVTHSMGGILIRTYLQDHDVPAGGRVVMLAPPNRGSAVVDAHRDSWWFRTATGPAGQQLGTGPDSVPRRLEPIPLEVGVIAGAYDAKVSIRSTRLEGMKDHIVVDSAHTLLMNSPTVVRQVKAFLKNGRFERE
jgi:triacylglycerol lipase